MACRVFATDPSTVRRFIHHRLPRRRQPMPPTRQMRLLQRLVRWLLSCQQPVDISLQIPARGDR